jgi:RNA polymerase sigma factor (sigma-70 family)
MIGLQGCYGSGNPVFKKIFSSDAIGLRILLWVSEPTAIADASRSTRSSLLTGVRDWENAAAWREFFDTYWHRIYAVARRAGLDDATAQDVVQDTLITVAKNLREFRYDAGTGSFKGWLLNTTRWRIADRQRIQQAARLAPPPEEPGTGTPWLSRVPAPAGDPLAEVWEDEWRHNTLEVALARVKGRVKPRQFQLFDCFVIQGWPMTDITRRLGVSAGQVYFAKYKVSALLRREVERLTEEEARGPQLPASGGPAA